MRAARPATVVEFGMSLGLSAIHLASAVRDNGAGRVVTTELSAAKVTAATATFAEVGLADVITVLAGDALQTLADLDAPVDFVLLDGGRSCTAGAAAAGTEVEPGALVVADNTGLPDTQPYVDHVRDPANGYM